MCGIGGGLLFDPERPFDPQRLERMVESLVHRGPDSSGIHRDGPAALGIRRLAIVDLVTGDQPLSNEDGSVWVVLNGQIYNHLALRRELEAHGHHFKTRADTEVLVHGYEEWGLELPKRLHGMFAVAIWDAGRRRLLLARDRIGIKPLFLYQDAERLLFGSEIKAILAHGGLRLTPDPVAFDSLLSVEYIPAPRTPFREIRKLEPGHLLVADAGGVRTQRYWQVRYRADRRGDPVELLAKLRAAVEERLMSDVPLGAFLSGGIDSGAVVGLMAGLIDQPVQTFSIGFDDPSYDELAHARRIARAFRTDHSERVIRPEAVALVERLLPHLDDPIADFSIFPTFLVSELARERVTVALSGDGGDELFAGYDTYLAERADRIARKLPAALHRLGLSALAALPPTARKKGLFNRLRRFAEGARMDTSLGHLRWMLFLDAAQRAELYGGGLLGAVDPAETLEPFRRHAEQSGAPDPITGALYIDLKTYLADDILVKVDRMSMAVSLEARVPFLDHRVVEYAASLELAAKLRGLSTKRLLRQALSGLLPPETLARGKQGFSIPMKNWLRGELKPMLLDTLSEARVRRRGWFAWPAVERLQREHLAGQADHAHRLWALLLVERWLERFGRHLSA
ncbi:MAG TPA: asparagine synthase (glutamine-hydrolyzing) [Acidobacteriota bacterium]